jgi:hypothetical protein
LRSVIGAVRALAQERRETADLILQFLMDIPHVPSKAVGIIATLCVGNVANSSISNSATESRNKHGIVAEASSSSDSEYLARSAMACLIYALLLRPGIRPAVVDTLLALAASPRDDVAEIARKSALGNVTKRLMFMRQQQGLETIEAASSSLSLSEEEEGGGGIRGHVIAFARALLHAAGAAGVHQSEEGDEEKVTEGEGTKRMRGDGPPQEGREGSSGRGTSTVSNFNVLLAQGAAANVSSCAHFGEMMVENLASKPLETAGRAVRLWLAAATVSPSLLQELVQVGQVDQHSPGVGGDTQSAELPPFVRAASKELREALPSLRRGAARTQAMILCALAGGNLGDGPSSSSSPASASAVEQLAVESGSVAILHSAVEALVDHALTEAAEEAKRTEEASGTGPPVLQEQPHAAALAASVAAANAAAAAAAAVTASALIREVPAITDLIDVAKRLQVREEAAVEGTAERNGSVVPVLLVPLVATLQPADLRQVIRAVVRDGSATTIRYLMRRVLHTPHCVSSLAPDEVMAVAIIAADGINARSCSQADKVRLLTEVSNGIFHERAVFTERVLLSGIRRIVDSSLAGKVSSSSSRAAETGQATIPVLLMRCMLVAVQMYPELRSSVVELLLYLLRKAGASAFEPVAGLREWGSATSSAPAAGSWPVWEGFIMLVKATVPLSLPLLVDLPEEHFGLLLRSKTQPALAQRFRSWFATWSGREAAPKAVKDLVDATALEQAAGGKTAASAAPPATTVLPAPAAAGSGTLPQPIKRGR